MDLNCALLHTDAQMLEKLQGFIGNIPFLILCGSYTDPLAALKEYYVSKVDVYVVGLSATSTGEIGGMDFCRLLSSYTRGSSLWQTRNALPPTASDWMPWIT